MMKNVPQGWRIEKLGNLGKIRTGKKDANHNTPDGEYEFFTCAAEPLKSKTYSFDGKSLIMAGNGANVGLVLYYEGKFEAYQRTYVANELSENPKYIYYHLKRFWSSHNDLKQFGSATNYIKLENLTDYPIQIPPLPQQEKIVSVLDIASALVEKQKALLEKYDLFLKSKFIEMFGNPVKNPMGWEVVKLKDLTSKIGSGATPKGGKEAYHSEGISLIRSLNVHDNQFLYKDLAFIDDKQADGLSNVVVEQNDVLLNITGASVCRTTIVPDNVLPARVNQHVAIIRPKSNMLNSKYLLHFFLSNYKQHLIHLATAGGATREALTKADIEELDILLPPFDLQNQFAQIVEQLESIKQKEQEKLEKLQTLYDALMKRAFDGEIA